MDLIKLLLLFTFTEVVHSLVDIELSVLQFDNPLGTSYTGQNLNNSRKCCDTGGSNCRNTNDTCDVYFTFCIGSLSHSSVEPGCNGTVVDMSKDISHDVFKITDTRHLRRFMTATDWLKGSTQVIVNVLDLDELPAPPNEKHVFPDLIDAFNKLIDFEPAQTFLSSQLHVISLIGHVSLDVGIRAWCASGWYGHSCERQCTADEFHSCFPDGTLLTNRECTDINTLVLILNTTLPYLFDITTLKRNITHFLADNICLKTTARIDVRIHEIREQRDGHIDVVFNAFCDNTTVSNLKFREMLYVSDQITTALDPPKSYFISQVILPRIQYVKEAFTGFSLLYLIRFVHYENKLSSPSAPHLPEFTVFFPERRSSPMFLIITSNNLTDCNGVYTDVGKSHSTTFSTKSTLLFSLNNYQNGVFIEVRDAHINTLQVWHNFSLSELVVGTNFRDSYPKILPTSTGAFSSLTIEVMAWCGNCRQGNHCQVDVGNSCNKAVTVLPPDCRVQSECKHGGRCVNQKCQCLQGWIGPTCNTDIDECALGVCEHIQSCTNTPGGYNCTCSTGFSGKYCEVDIDECFTNPCQPGLECLNTYGSFTCIGVCADKTLNPNCTGNIIFCSEESCQNNATCVNNAKNYTCKCSGGWSGNKCEINFDECTDLTLCHNGGKCIDSPGSFSCRCPNSYTGQYCDIDVDECLHSGSCSNNGTCANTPGGFTCICPSSYTGHICEVDVDECRLKDLCRNNGTCVNKPRGYTCACSIGYSGVNCQQDIDECSSINPCMNGGICINNPGSYTCNCTKYWRGKHCQDDVDECLATYACHLNGNCTNTNGSFTCSCYSGWTGVTCADDINECLSLPCLNSGTCYNTNGGYSCICPTNWEGKNCDQDVNECNVNSPCDHGGTCINFPGSYNCTCTSNWTGSNCTDDVDECLRPDACSNSGSCVNTDGSYLCNCLPQWTGPRCAIVVNECLGQPCFNGGTCLNVANGYSCSCTPSWTGKNCSDNVDIKCLLHAGICVHGVCHDTQDIYTCDCMQGYEGINCDIDINECSVSGICQNGGTCENMNGSYICHCLKGWQGINCTEDLNECLSQNPCHHSGVCENINVSFTCLCQQGWTGKTCETDIDECFDTPCLHGGTCVNNDGNFTCNCDSGWEGNTCENNTDECKVNSCKNGGACQNLINDFMCVCRIGYTGKLCDIDIDDCASQPCNNGGKCHDHTGYFECVCPEGWKGTRCSEDVDECGNHPCGAGESCQIVAGSFMCVKEHFTAVSKATTTASSAKPLMIDVFSLEFVGPISDDIKPKIREGIVGILKLLMCHDSTIIDVSLVQNSIKLPNTVEFVGQCDGHYLTNYEVNDAIRTLTDDKLRQYFPIGLKNTYSPPENQDTSWVLAVVGSFSGLVVISIVAITAIYIKRRKNNTMSTNEQTKADSPTPTSRQESEAAADQYEGIYDEIQSEDLKMTGGKRATFVSHKELLRMNVYNEIPELTVCSQNSYEETVPNQADNAHVYLQLSSSVNTYEAVRNKDSDENPYSRISHKEAVDRFGSFHESIKDSVDERRYLELSYLQ